MMRGHNTKRKGKPISIISHTSCLFIAPTWQGNSATRLDKLLKFSATNFLTKVAKVFVNFLGYFKKHHFLSKNCCGWSMGTFWKCFSYFHIQRLVTLQGNCSGNLKRKQQLSPVARTLNGEICIIIDLLFLLIVLSGNQCDQKKIANVY